MIRMQLTLSFSLVPVKHKVTAGLLYHALSYACLLACCGATDVNCIVVTSAIAMDSPPCKVWGMVVKSCFI